MKKLEEKLKARSAADALRTLTVKKGLADFYSNDYLGLAGDKELQEQIYQEYKNASRIPFVNGSSGSRLLSGHHDYFQQVESELSGLYRAEKSLIINSGYNANLTILSTVPQKGDTILMDELAHASLKDGARLSFAKKYSFRHNDLQDLEKKLNKSEGEKFVVTESVFSMDGDLAPLQQLVRICEKYSAHLILDEAHSTGIFNEDGAGLSVLLGLHDKIFARIYTFGKAVGQHGAVITGSASLIDFLINFARPFIYTTALPLHSLCSIRTALKYIKNNPKRREQLFENIRLFNSKVNIIHNKSDTFDKLTESAIRIIPTPGNNVAKKFSRQLEQRGFDVRPILSPTVKQGQERLRICIHSSNNEEEISNLCNALTIITQENLIDHL